LNGFIYCHVVVDSVGRPVDFFTVEVNSAFEQVTGFRRGQVVGKRLTDLFPDFRGSGELIGALGDVGVSGVPISFVTYFGPLDKWFSISAYSPRRGDFIALFEDISVQKRAEDVIKEANRRLEAYSLDLERTVEERTRQLKDAERLAAIGATAGMVGHDIRNPLQAIVGDLYLVKEELAGAADGELKRSLLEEVDAIEANVFYINKIVADLQDYARPLGPVFVEVDILPLIEAALSSKIVPENIEVSCHVEEDARIICTDPDLLKRVLNNLGMNAIQAMPDGGKVTVEVCRRGAETVISVADTGGGISDEVKARLFTPMFTTKSKGQGFGLAVVKRLTEALGGSVSFESEIGKGTKFTVKLP
jgi:signal transduction histidine kinase